MVSSCSNCSGSLIRSEVLRESRPISWYFCTIDCLFSFDRRDRGRRGTSNVRGMLRGFALRCLEPVSPRATASPYASMLRGGAIIPRRNYERFRRSGDGRKREWFEEKSAASQDEYFRKETARQLKELRRALKRKAEEEKEMECVKRRRKARRRDDVACPPSFDKKRK